MKTLIFASCLTLVSCGQTPKGNSTGASELDASTASVASSQVAAPKVAVASQSSQSASYSRLVADLSSIECTADINGELIYSKADQGFYYCADDLQWTAIDIKGAKGDKGDAGEQGIAGAQGVAGKDAVGKDGKDGIDGSDGKDGIDGTNGTNGANGSNGISMVAQFKITPHHAITGGGILDTAFVSLFSDGSMFVSVMLIISDQPETETFFVGKSETANTKLTILSNVLVPTAGGTILIRTQSGNSLLNQLTDPNQPQSGWNCSLGVEIVSNGVTDTSAMSYFLLAYDQN